MPQGSLLHGLIIWPSVAFIFPLTNKKSLGILLICTHERRPCRDKSLAKRLICPSWFRSSPKLQSINHPPPPTPIQLLSNCFLCLCYGFVRVRNYQPNITRWVEDGHLASISVSRTSRFTLQLKTAYVLTWISVASHILRLIGWMWTPFSCHCSKENVSH